MWISRIWLFKLLDFLYLQYSLFQFSFTFKAPPTPCLSISLAEYQSINSGDSYDSIKKLGVSPRHCIMPAGTRYISCLYLSLTKQGNHKIMQCVITRDGLIDQVNNGDGNIDKIYVQGYPERCHNHFRFFLCVSMGCFLWRFTRLWLCCSGFKSNDPGVVVKTQKSQMTPVWFVVCGCGFFTDNNTTQGLC